MTRYGEFWGRAMLYQVESSKCHTSTASAFDYHIADHLTHPRDIRLSSPSPALKVYQSNYCMYHPFHFRQSDKTWGRDDIMGTVIKKTSFAARLVLAVCFFRGVPTARAGNSFHGFFSGPARRCGSSSSILHETLANAYTDRYIDASSRYFRDSVFISTTGLG